MKTLTKGILGVAITAACAYCGYTTYDSYIYQQENALLLANVEAWDRMNQEAEEVIYPNRPYAKVLKYIQKLE